MAHAASEQHFLSIYPVRDDMSSQKTEFGPKRELSKNFEKVYSVLCAAQSFLQGGLHGVDLATKERAYGTWLGFYKGYAGKLGWDSAALVQEANHFSGVIGAANPHNTTHHVACA